MSLAQPAEVIQVRLGMADTEIVLNVTAENIHRIKDYFSQEEKRFKKV